MKALSLNTSLRRVSVCIFFVLFFVITIDSSAQQSASVSRKECYKVVNALVATNKNGNFILDSKVTSTQSRTSSIDRSIQEDSSFSDSDKAYMENQATHPKLKRWTRCKVHGATIVRDRRLRRFFMKNDNGWGVFQKKYGVDGFYFFSVPLLTKDGRRSNIYAAYECAGICGEGYIYTLEQKAGTWIVSSKKLIWKS